MILDLFRLNGKVAVVTGANTGLGQGFCVAFAEAGATVIGVARRSCAETAAKVEAVGGTFFEVLTDLSAPDASKTVANACKKLTGRVDISCKQCWNHSPRGCRKCHRSKLGSCHQFK